MDTNASELDIKMASTSDQLLNDNTAVELLNDNTSVQLLNDNTAVELLNDNTSVQLLNDNTSVQLLNDNTSVQLLNDNTTINSIPVDIILGNNVNTLTITADTVSVSVATVDDKLITGNVSVPSSNLKLEKNTVIDMSLGGNEVFFTSIKDIIFHLILNIKPLRCKLNQLLDIPNKAIIDISNIFKEVSDKLSASDMDNLRKFFLIDTTKASLSDILLKSFNDIMLDGKIDLNDTTHFLTLIYNIVNLFNNYTQQLEVSLSINSETVNIFLYFIIKCVLILTLDNNEEAAALGLLDVTFKLVSISVLPISTQKTKCGLFSCFQQR